MSRTVKSLLLALAATGLCLAGRATAQDMPESVFQSSAKRAHEGSAVNYREYYAEEPAKPRFEDAVVDAPKGDDKPATEETEPAEEEKKDDANPCGDPWTLQSLLTPCLGENTQWKYGGWIEGGITGNDHGVVSLTGNLPVAFNYASDGAMLNQAWAFAERTAKTDGCGMDWGFRADYIFGTDAFFTQAFGDIGYDNNWDASLQYASALPQLYLVGAYNDLTVKAGHFFTPIGNEVVGATGNFFYSHAYTMLYGEPFTHTGVQADYKVNDQLTVTAGWVQGWDSGFNNVNNANCFLGGFTWTSCDQNTSLLWYLTAGDWGSGVNVQSRGTTLSDGNIYMQSIVAKHKFSGGWQYIFQSDLGVNTNIPGDSTCWYGINQYLIKDLNCCWSFGARLEWFKDQDGVRVFDANGNGNAGSYYEATAGLNWKPHANVNVRPELRYDWYTGQGTPYADATQKNALTFGVDAIFTF